VSKKTNKNHAASGAAPSLALVETPVVSNLKLDLGCGQNPREGFEGVDLYGDKAKFKVDLFKFPWPFADESVEEINASHLLEHIPAREVEFRDLHLSTLSPGGEMPSPAVLATYKDAESKYLGADFLFAFIDECYRILKPDCWMHVVVPSGRSNRAFWDPTHRRFFMQETFLYFARDWRKMNGLDHYRIRANFGVDVGHTLPTEEGLRSPDAQATRFLHYWNVTVDWVAKMKKQPQ
jgi:predicted SAM-dependent methyltransferase